MKIIFKRTFTSILVSITILGITGCSDNDDEENSYLAYFSNDAIAYDYYEIANDTILHTSINEDVYNIRALYPIFGNEQMSEHIDFIDNYSLENKSLDINETIDVYRQKYLNLFTDKSYQSINQKDYGLREIKTNYCNINTDVSACETYVYIRKI